jgi:hypothetical protein
MSFPKLTGLAQSRPVVIFGGIPSPEKVRSYQKELGVQTLEWIEVERHDRSNTLEGRVRNGSVGAVVVLEGWLKHRQHDSVIAACRTNRIPWAFGGKGGKGLILQAFEALEKQLSRS